MRFVESYISLAARINRVLEAICTVCVIFMVSILWLQVFVRYFLGFSFVWVEEVAKVLMVYMAMLASAILVFEDGHVSVSFLLEKIKFSYAIRYFFLLLIIAFSIVLTYSGVIFAAGTVRHSWMTGISYAYYHWSIPIGGFFLITQSVAQLLKLVRSKGNPEAEEPAEEEVR